MENPFVFGSELEPGQLVDREEEVGQVVRAMTGRQKLFLIGPRRFGKTSILNVAQQEAHASGAVVLRHDAEAYPTFEALVNAIIASAARELTTTIKRAGEQVVKFFGTLRPQVTFDATAQTWSASLCVGDRRPEKSATLLVDALDGIAKMAADIDRPVAVDIDEFQHLIEVGGETVERQLRATIQRHSRVSYIFAGSKTALLDDMTLSPARPFYRLGTRLFLGPIPRKDFGEAIRRGFARAKFTIDADALDHLFELAEDVPYNVQALANMSWEVVRSQDRKTRLTLNDLERALDQLVSQDSPFYSKLWNLCTQPQQRALTAVAVMHGKGLHAQAALQRFRLSPSLMTKSLNALASRDIIRRDETYDEVRWRLEDPFFAAWLAKVGAVPIGA
jgi:uncharacterized protein